VPTIYVCKSGMCSYLRVYLLSHLRLIQGDAHQAQVQLQQQLAQQSLDMHAGPSNAAIPFLESVAGMAANVKPAAIAAALTGGVGILESSSCRRHVVEEMPKPATAAGAATCSSAEPGLPYVKSVRRPSFKSSEAAGAAATIGASGTQSGCQVAETSAAPAQPAVAASCEKPAKSSSAEGLDAFSAVARGQGSPSAGSAGESDLSQRWDLAFVGQAAEARYVAAANIALVYLDQVFILLSFLVSLSCYLGTADGQAWDYTTWLSSGTFWLTPFLAFGLYQVGCTLCRGSC
jgi:hypothetical protein